MDKFLQNQQSGQVVDTQNVFTVDRARGRKKLLDSIPQGDVGACLRLFDSAVWQLGYEPNQTVYPQASDNASSVVINLKDLAPSLIDAYLEELRRPFGEPSAVSNLAKATFRATQAHARVDLLLPTTFLGTLSSALTLRKDALEVPEEIATKEARALQIYLSPALYDKFCDHKRSCARKVYELMDPPERLLPLESLRRETTGYFAYRTKPFTAIRSYACLPQEEETPHMQLDLWAGPYKELDPNTVILDKQTPGKFLFLRWRPNYGNPTFLHHFLDRPATFGLSKVRATFWVETIERAARFYFYSRNTVSDPQFIKGPTGMTGIVFWPELKYDIWGTQPVKDDAYEQAMAWIKSMIDRTAGCLASNLELVIERLTNSSLLKKPYIEETVQKARSFWG